MKSEEYLDIDRHAVWHPYTKHSSQQDGAIPVMVKGEGVFLYDVEGKEYLDAVSSWWCTNLGHSNKRLVKAIKDQADKLQHSILGNMSHPSAIELASRLCDLMPGNRRVLYASDGACAVEAALKIAVQYWFNLGRPEKTRFVSLEDAYHGDTIGSVSLGYMPSFHEPFSKLVFPGFKAESPCCGVCKYGKSPQDCDVECFGSMEKAITENKEELAGVVVEPLCQGAAGMRIYSPRYLVKLAECCKANEVLLIDDEVAMGFGRTGRMFAFEHADISPDIVCLGKGLSGGYLPISATVVGESIYETFSDQPDDHTFYHGHTFAGNPLAAAVAVETLKIYEEEDVVGKAGELSDLLEKEMVCLADYKFVKNVRCLGMIGAVELDTAERAQQVRSILLERGILIRPLGAVIYFMLPLVVSPDVLSDAVQSMNEALQSA